MAAKHASHRASVLLVPLALMAWIAAGAGCDLVAPKDRTFNGAVQQPTIGPIDPRALAPGQHMAGTWSFALDSLNSVHTANPPARAELYVDSTLATAAYAPPFVLTLDTHRAAEGTHVLTVLVYETQPSTGLVGAAGVPSQFLTTEVVFDQRPPTPVTLNSVVWENDRPRLDWTVNADANFAAYQVARDGNTAFDYPFPRPIPQRAAHTCLDTVGLRALIGAHFDYSVGVDNRNETAWSSRILLRNGDVFPGLLFAADASRPVPIPNRAEFYTYQESLKVYSTVTNQLVRAFRPFTGSSIAVTRDGGTLVLVQDALLGGIPGIATYSMDTFAPLTSARVNEFVGRYQPMVAPRDDRAVIAGTDGLRTLRVSDGTVLDTLELRSSQVKLALSPDGGTLYAATPDSVFRIDVSSDDARILERRAVSPQIADVQLSPDGAKLYLAHTIVSPSNFVEILDASTLSTVGSLTPPGNEWFYALWVTDRHLYLSHGRQDLPGRYYLPGSVVQYDRASLARLRSWDFVQVPQGVVTSADEQWLYACGFETWIVAPGAPLAAGAGR